MAYRSLKISIPTFRRVDEHNSYTVFSIAVIFAGRRYTVEKRYSEFEELHKMLKSKYPALLFPGKSMLKWSPKLLEYRRQAFEHYLQAVIESQKIPRCVMNFLEISDTDNSGSSESLDQLETSCSVRPLLQPVIAFSEDAFLHHEHFRDGLPNIIAIGTLQGLYGSHSSVNDIP